MSEGELVKVLKKLLLVFVCIFLSNCSYVVLSDKDRVSGSCSALYYVVPVLDTSASVLSLVLLAALPTAIAYSSPSNGEVYQFLGGTIISAAAFGSSAVHGYSRVYECRSK